MSKILEECERQFPHEIIYIPMKMFFYYCLLVKHDNDYT